MPLNAHNTQPLPYLVSLQHLQRHNSRILHQVAHDLAVENLQRTVIRRVGKQRVPTLVVRHGSNSSLVETQCFVGLGGQVEIVPEQALGVGSHEKVVAAGMHVDAADPFGAGLQDLDEFLLVEVVGPGCVSGGEEDDGFAGVEL